MNKYSLSALVAAGLLAGGMTAGSATAADLGGNCCADLEERIAELEATTARKGNRKVSLTIAGFVAQQVMYWDDGGESNVYVTDTGSVSIGTHVRFTGQATIAPGWSAGYVLKLEAIQNDSLLVNQGADNGIAANAMSVVAGQSNSAVAVESSYWFVKSEELGRLSVGKQSSAADNQAILPDGSGTLVVANYVMYDVNAFAIRRSDTGNLTGIGWGNLATCATLDGGGGVAGDCDGYPSNNVRYDTPVFAGFSGSASWGEDDMWAVSGRYAGEFGGFKLAAAIAYNASTDENGPGGLLIAHTALDAQAAQAGAYVEHVASGLFVYGAYAKEYVDVIGLTSPAPFLAPFNASNKTEGEQWYVKAGVRTRLSGLGHTIFYGEYGEKEDMMDSATFARGVTDSNITQYGLGVVQEIDAAAMSVWLSWRHYEADVTCDGPGGGGFTCVSAGLVNGFGTGASTPLEDLDIIKAGALINF